MIIDLQYINKAKGQFEGFSPYFSAILVVNKRNGRKSSSIALWLWKSGQKSNRKIINDPRKKTKIYQNGFKSILKEHSYSYFCHSAFVIDHFFKTFILLQYSGTWKNIATYFGIDFNQLHHIAIGSFNGLIGKKQERKKKPVFISYKRKENYILVKLPRYLESRPKLLFF